MTKTQIFLQNFCHGQICCPKTLESRKKPAENKQTAKAVCYLSRCSYSTVYLLVGLGYWNDWLNGLYYINNDKLYSIQVLLNKMLLDVQYLMSGASGGALTQNITLPATGIKMAVAVMGALPILVVYPFFQKYFVKGIVIGAVKG